VANLAGYGQDMVATIPYPVYYATGNVLHRLEVFNVVVAR